jgi:hypothetical protein
MVHEDTKEFLAGTVVPAGRYQRTDAADRIVVRLEAGPLPPSFDGHIAAYYRLQDVERSPQGNSPTPEPRALVGATPAGRTSPD